MASHINIYVLEVILGEREKMGTRAEIVECGTYQTDKHTVNSVKKVKLYFYIAQYPVRWTAQSALHFTPWQTCSF